MMQNTIDTRVDALYGRQSVDKADSISIESQLEFCIYETHGGAYEEYRDKGFSGKNTNRPDFERMMKDISAGKIKRVIVYKLDRISRSILDFANMMEVFQQNNVEFVSSTEKFDTSTPIGRAMLNICIVFAQLERETIQKRVADAYYSRSIKGYYMGGRIPYGFQLKKTVINDAHVSVFEPAEPAAQCISNIYEWYYDPDVTLGEVQRRLEANPVFKNDKVWCTARISEILRNPIYVKADISIYNFYKSQGAILINPATDYIGTNGLFLYKGKGSDGTKKKQYDLKDREVVIAPNKGIIESYMWLGCRLKIMNNRQSARTNKGKRTWLAGKIKCKKCGYAYITTKNIQGNRYFQCSGRRYSVRCKGTGSTVYAEQLEEYIYNEMKSILSSFEYLSPNDSKKDASAVSAYQMEIAEKDKEIQALLDKLLTANEALELYINQRVAALDERKRALEEKIMQLSCNPSHQDYEKLTNYVEKWDTLSIDDKQRVVDLLIKVIYLEDEEIEIEWNI